MQKNLSNISGLHHIAIRAIDFDCTLKFYTEGLGFSVSLKWSLPQFNLKHAAMLISPDGNSFIELFDAVADIAAQGRKKESHEDYTQTALLHFCLSVKNASDAYEQAIAAGALPCIEPSTFTLGNSSIRICNSLVYSPNGEVIEFLEKADFK